jgi:hypothetical protein
VAANYASATVHAIRSEFCGGSDAVCTPPIASSIIDFTANSSPASVHDAPNPNAPPQPTTLAIDSNDVILDSIVSEDFDFATDYSFDADTDDLLEVLCS